jgi:hypothetical protein
MPSQKKPERSQFVKHRSVRTWTVPTDPGGLTDRLDRTLRRLTGAPQKTVAETGCGLLLFVNKKGIIMALDQLGQIALSDRNAVREVGSKLAKGITDLLLAEVSSGRLTVVEGWLVIVGVLYSVGRITGSISPTMLDHVRESFAELDRLHGGLIL